jgi:hypothetical protein
VIVFVLSDSTASDVASIEQLMLFDTILDYIVNSVVVLVIAELDELAFQCLSHWSLRRCRLLHRGQWTSGVLFVRLRQDLDCIHQQL